MKKAYLGAEQGDRRCAKAPYISSDRDEINGDHGWTSWGLDVLFWAGASALKELWVAIRFAVIAGANRVSAVVSGLQSPPQWEREGKFGRGCFCWVLLRATCSRPLVQCWDAVRVSPAFSAGPIETRRVAACRPNRSASSCNLKGFVALSRERYLHERVVWGSRGVPQGEVLRRSVASLKMFWKTMT